MEAKIGLRDHYSSSGNKQQCLRCLKFLSKGRRACMCPQSFQTCPTFCNPMGCSPPGSSVHGILQGENTGVGCCTLHQGIFPTQGSNWRLLPCRRIFYHWATREAPIGRSDQIRSDQSLSRVQLFATPWITARQASLSIANSRSSLRLTSIESVMPSSHLILCHPLLLLPPIPPSFRVFSNGSTLCMRWPKYWNFSFSIIPSKEIPGLISGR